MRLIVEIPDEHYEIITDKIKAIRVEVAKKGYANDPVVYLGWEEIADGIPYIESERGDAISRSRLRTEVSEPLFHSTIPNYGEVIRVDKVMEFIDKAPVVEQSEIWGDGFADGLAVGAKWVERPQEGKQNEADS